MNPLLTGLAILPALIICFFIYRVDRYDKESYWQLIVCFVLGMLVTFPAMHLEAFGESIGFAQGETHLGKLLVLSFIVVGLTEELAKFIPLMAFGYTRKEFNEPLDGIVYSVMIAMGFATLENIIYADRFGLGTTVIRAFTAVPAHAVFAVFMGYYVGLAKFNKKKRISFLAIGLLLASVIHGLYDFFILQEYYDWLMLFATLTLCVSLFFAIQLIRQHQLNSPFQENPNNTVEPSGDIADAEIVEEDCDVENTEDTTINNSAKNSTQKVAATKTPPPPNIPEEYNEISDAVIREMEEGEDDEGA